MKRTEIQRKNDDYVTPDQSKYADLEVHQVPEWWHAILHFRGPELGMAFLALILTVVDLPQTNQSIALVGIVILGIISWFNKRVKSKSCQD